MKYIILLILIIFSINGVCAEPFIEQYSNSYSSDSCLFGARYFTHVKYTITNDDNITKKIDIGFLNNKNKIMGTKKIIISKNSSFSDNINIRTGTFLYVLWGNKEEPIYIKILNSEDI